MPDQAFFDWLGKGTGTGKYFITAVNQGDETVAWLLCRLYRSGGLLHGAILDLRLKRADREVAVNALKGAGRMLANHGVDDVRAFTTSEFMAAAYVQSGYRAGRETVPALLWSGKRSLVSDRIALSCNPDQAFWPLETEAPEAVSSTGRNSWKPLIKNREDIPCASR